MRNRPDFSPARFRSARLQVPWPRPASFFDLMFSFARQSVLTAHAVKLTFATALLAAATACSGGTSTGRIVPEGDILLSASSTAVQPLFDLMESAPQSVAFRALRRILVSSGPNPTEFREELASDGVMVAPQIERPLL